MILIRQIASDFCLPEEYIAKIARTASHLYKIYQIKKRSGGMRTIHHPAKQLKALQRWLASHVISKLRVHDAAMAYRAKRSISDNAKLHAGKEFLLRMDLKDFFPSLTANDVEACLRDDHGTVTREWEHADYTTFCQLVCRAGHLTIGAPTSPGLSNALCFRLDTELAALCGRKNVTYSRYADDLFFSVAQPEVLRNIELALPEILVKLPYPRKIRINEDKTFHGSRKRRKQVTGIILTSDGQTSLGRHFKRGVRAKINSLENLIPAERQSLAGLLAYCRSIEPDFINRLILKYGSHRVDQAMSPTAEKANGTA